MTKSLKELRTAQKSKKLSTDDFNALYSLIRDGTKHPEVKRVGGTKIDYREQ